MLLLPRRPRNRQREIVIMSTKTINANRLNRQAGDQKLADGLTKHRQALAALMIGGASHTVDDILAILQARLAAAGAAESTRATWQTAVKADRDERAKTKTFVSGLRQALLVAFTGSIDALADFGLSPRKLRVLTPEKKAAAAAKAKATRVARHTVGPKKKLAIKGTVPQTAPAASPAVVTAPAPASPTAPAAAPVPAAPASPSPTAPAAVPTPAAPHPLS
jgi:hypothetical protein